MWEPTNVTVAAVCCACRPPACPYRSLRCDYIFIAFHFLFLFSLFQLFAYLIDLMLLMMMMLLFFKSVEISVLTIALHLIIAMTLSTAHVSCLQSLEPRVTDCCQTSCVHCHPLVTHLSSQWSTPVTCCRYTGGRV